MVTAGLPGLVIFDCDGVLVNSEPITNIVIVENLARHGLELTLAECMEKFVGGTIADVGKKAAAMGATIPRGWLDDIYAEIYARLRQGVDPIAGVTEVLDALDAAHVPYCVGSNGSTEKMSITLGGTGLADRFAGRLFSAHEVGVAKPDPELFLHAARAFGVAAENCVVIEDSATGARAAAAAKMRCFGYAAETPGEKLQVEGAAVFTDMGQLPALIGL